jgi:hypothetical protein
MRVNVRVCMLETHLVLALHPLLSAVNIGTIHFTEIPGVYQVS